MKWISTKDKLPPEGVLVEAKLGRSRVVEKLQRFGNLWFTHDEKLYIWHRPTHWLNESHKP